MNLLRTPPGRRFLFAALYASEGAPVGYIWWALPTKLAAAGLSAEQVALFMAPLVLPWSFKFLWAPLVDALQGRGWGLRAWIVSAQIAMGLTLLPALWLSPVEHQQLLAFVFLAHAVFAATQDVAIDGLCVRATPRDEQGAINGWMQLGLVTSRAVFGGLVLGLEQQVLIGRLGMTPDAANALVLGLLLVCIWSTMLLVIFFVREERAAGDGSAAGDEGAARSAAAADVEGALYVAPRARRFAVFVRSLRAALSRPTTWLGLGFALIGGAAFEGVAALSRPLLVERGWSQTDVGVQFTIATVIAMATGALAGGWLADRMGRVRVVAGLTIFVACAVFAVAAVFAWAPEAGGLLYALFVLLYLLLGAVTAASYGMFMNLTDRNLGATQFSAYMGATNLCEVWAIAAAGWLIGAYGHAWAFGALAGASLLGLPLLAGIARALRNAAVSEVDESRFRAEGSGFRIKFGETGRD